MGIPLPEHLVLSDRAVVDFRGVVNFRFTEFYEVRYPQATPSYGKDSPFGGCTPTSLSGILLLMVGLL